MATFVLGGCTVQPGLVYYHTAFSFPSFFPPLFCLLTESNTLSLRNHRDAEHAT